MSAASLEAAGADLAPSPRFAFARDFAASRVAVVAAIVLAALVIAALLAPWIVPQDPYDLAKLDILDAQLPPGSMAGGSGFGPSSSAPGSFAGAAGRFAEFAAKDLASQKRPGRQNHATGAKRTPVERPDAGDRASGYEQVFDEARYDS